MPDNDDPAPPFLKVAGIELGLAFERSDISERLQQAIITDLNLVYGHLKEHEIVPYSGNIRFQLSGDEIAPSAWINFRGGGLHRPDEIEELIGFLIDKNGELQTLVVPDEVITLYDDAIRRRERHLRQYRELDEFIRSLNQMDSRDIGDPKHLFFIAEESSALTDALANWSTDSFQNTYGDRHYVQPSLLEIVEVRDHDQDWGMTLWAKLYDQSKGARKIFPFPLIYHDESWKFFVQLQGHN